jgi:hypothetical protein
MMTMERRAIDWHIRARPFVQEPYLTEKNSPHTHMYPSGPGP